MCLSRSIGKVTWALGRHFVSFFFVYKSSKGSNKKKEEFEDKRERGVVTKLRERMGFRAHMEGISLRWEEN